MHAQNRQQFSESLAYTQPSHENMQERMNVQFLCIDFHGFSYQ